MIAVEEREIRTKATSANYNVVIKKVFCPYKDEIVN